MYRLCPAQKRPAALLESISWAVGTLRCFSYDCLKGDELSPDPSRNKRIISIAPFRPFLNDYPGIIIVSVLTEKPSLGLFSVTNGNTTNGIWEDTINEPIHFSLMMGSKQDPFEHSASTRPIVTR